MKIQAAMSFADLLGSTNSDGKGDRIEARALPKDTALEERYALVFAGPHARDLLMMMVEALNREFDKAQAALSAPVNVNGSDARS